MCWVFWAVRAPSSQGQIHIITHIIHEPLLSGWWSVSPGWDPASHSNAGARRKPAVPVPQGEHTSTLHSCWHECYNISHLDVQLLHYGNSWYRFLQNFTCSSVNIKKLVVLNTVKCFAGDVYIVLILISHSAGWNTFFQSGFLLNHVSLFLIEADINFFFFSFFP